MKMCPPEKNNDLTETLSHVIRLKVQEFSLWWNNQIPTTLSLTFCREIECCPSMLALDIHLLIIKLMNFGEEEMMNLMTHYTSIEWQKRVGRAQEISLRSQVFPHFHFPCKRVWSTVTDFCSSRERWIFFQCQSSLTGMTRQWYKHLMWHRLRYKLLQVWGKPLTLIFGCFSISSTIMPDLQIVWLRWPGIPIYIKRQCQEMFVTP